MKRLALAAMLLVVCVAFVAAQDAPEPRLYVQIAFESAINGAQDAEAKAAWDAFVAAINKDIAPVTATCKQRDAKKSPTSSFLGAVNQPLLSASQIASLSIEVGKLIDAPCFLAPHFSMKLSREHIEIRAEPKSLRLAPYVTK